MNIKHSKDSVEWYTPESIVEMAREVLGTIDLDPASCEEANKIVKADKIYTKDDDGTTKEWFGNVFVNPPGGRIRTASLTNLFWYKFINENFNSGIYIGYSLEQLQTLQNFTKVSPLHFPICIPSKRIAFISPNGDKSSPSHGNFICYRGNRTTRFLSVFRELGTTLNFLNCHDNY